MAGVASTEGLPVFRSPRLIAKLTTAAFVIFAVGAIWEISLSVEAISATANPAGFDDAWAEGFDQRFAQASYGSLGFLALTAVFFGIWTYRVAKNARCFDQAELKVSPGWAVGYYFIPILSLWRPYQALVEIWRASTTITPKRVPAWVTVWWVAWLVSSFAERFLANAEGETLEEWASLHRQLIILKGFDICAAALAMAVVWRLTRIQDERWILDNPARATIEKG